jgi:glycosyltransferase involved in cell wall biosynthesis
MLISIVLPTFNRSHVLGRAIDSVLAQTYSNWELIIVDNHSSDHTDILVNNYHNSKIVLLKIHNKGIIAKSRNCGINHAHGELVAFLDSDDWWSPKKLEKSLQFINSGADIVYHDLYIVRNENQNYFWNQTKSFQVHEPVYDCLINLGNALPNSSVVVKKKLLEEIGCLSEDYEMISWEDYDCWLKISQHTERFMRIKETLGFYAASEGNISSEFLTKNYREFQRRYHDDRVTVFSALFYYRIGRLFFNLRLYDEAIPKLVYSLSAGSMFIRLKSIFTIGVIYFKSMCSKIFRRD